MAKRDKSHPDYTKLYPGAEIAPEVAQLLKRSDRKMEYMEVDLKRGSQKAVNKRRHKVRDKLKKFMKI